MFESKGQFLMLIAVFFIPIIVQLIPTDYFLLNKTNYNNPQAEKHQVAEKLVRVEKKKPIYWFHSPVISPEKYLTPIITVLEGFGYEKGTNESDWDFLWSHPYPFFSLEDQMAKIKPHQRVNHISGLMSLTTKGELAATGNKYLPKSFKLPQDEKKLREYARQNPKVRFVQKHNEHRHIQIKTLDKIDFSNRDFFVQEYVENPLLLDGHKFDIGIYTVITSINPLRVYTYEGDALIRFCPEKYHPLNVTNMDQYIIATNHIESWHIEGLRPFYDSLGFNGKSTLNGYLRSKKRNPDVIWKQIDEIIRYTFYDHEPTFIRRVCVCVLS